MDTQHNELHDNRYCKIHGAFTKFDDSKQENVCANCGQEVLPSTPPTPVSRTAEEIEQMAEFIFTQLEKNKEVPYNNRGLAMLLAMKITRAELYRTQPEEREERVRIAGDK